MALSQLWNELHSVLMEQVALGSSLNELCFGILTMQSDSTELPVALLLNLYGGSKIS